MPVITYTLLTSLYTLPNINTLHHTIIAMTILPYSLLTYLVFVASWHNTTCTYHAILYRPICPYYVAKTWCIMTLLGITLTLLGVTLTPVHYDLLKCLI